MAAITFDYTGTELTQTRAENPSPLAPIESGARVRVKKFSFTAAGAVASGSQVALLEFAKRVSIIGGAITNISFSDSATADLGWTAKATPVDTNKDVFVDGATAAAVFAAYMVTTTETTSFFLTTGVGDLAADDVIEGYVLYVENS
jgi:hypothetical protein